MQTTTRTMNNGVAGATAAVPAERTRDVPIFRPRIDIYETETELVVLADVPGAGPNDIDVKFENRMLTICARVPSRWPADASWLSAEYDLGDFERSFEVGETIDGNAITAEVENGVLTVHLPKAAAARPRKIQVQAK